LKAQNKINKKMKALLINKPFFIEPLGMMYLSSSAKKSGHQVELSLTSEDLEKKISEFNPDVIGYSVMTGDQDFYMDINRKLKKKFNFTSIFGGPHPTFFSDMIEEEGVDVVCKGEGEDAFRELLDKLESGKVIDYIPNLYVKNNGDVKKNMVRPFSDINSFEFPDRELVFRLPEIKEGPIKHFLASRGCPFSCSYCFNGSYSEIYAGKGKRVRFRDPKSVVDEVEDFFAKKSEPELQPVPVVQKSFDKPKEKRIWYKPWMKKASVAVLGVMFVGFALALVNKGQIVITQSLENNGASAMLNLQYARENLLELNFQGAAENFALAYDERHYHCVRLGLLLLDVHLFLLRTVV